MRQLCTANKPILPPSLKHHHGNAVGQIEAAIIWPHGQADTLCGFKLRQYFIWQAARFGAENEHVAGLKAARGEAARTFGGEREKPPSSQGGTARCPILMHLDAGVFVVIQPGAAQLFVFQREAEWLDQVQGAAGIGGETNDVTGVGGDFGLV